MGEGPMKNEKNEKNSAGEGGVKIPLAAENDKRRYERLLVVYTPLLGTRVCVFLYDGAVFEGTLDSFETVKEFALILRMATMIRPGREVIDPSIKAGVTFELMNIRFDDMAELKSATSPSKTSGGIGTDVAISKKKGDFGKERELHRWTPEESDGVNPALSLNATGNNSLGTSSWDQFATNERLFGLKTDFDEEIYTTKLDRNSAHIRANEAKAERIAREIMSASTGGNVHLAEERGQKVQSAVDDEEMLYGAVIREDHPGSALPPGFSKDSPSESANSTSQLNPSAPEFKLNVDAPEFVPSTSSAKVTYYNQPRRNLNQGNYNNYYNSAGYYGLPYATYPSVPYYYVPPPTTNSNNNNTSLSSSAANSAMNPDAADFVMPQMAAPIMQMPYQQYQNPYYGYVYNGYNNNNYGATGYAYNNYPNPNNNLNNNNEKTDTTTNNNNNN